MSVHLIVPVRSLRHGKTRLAPVLASAKRADLIAGMLVRVLDRAAKVAAIASVTVICADDQVRALARSRGAKVLADPQGADVNAALGYAATLANGATGILVLPADLPLLQSGDIDAMLAHERGAFVIAPDRSGDGTNALYRPASAVLPFRFGTGSFAAHCAAARATRLNVHVVRRPGLAFDLDTPEDYADWISGSRSPRNRPAG